MGTCAITRQISCSTSTSTAIAKVLNYPEAYAAVLYTSAASMASSCLLGFLRSARAGAYKAQILHDSQGKIRCKRRPNGAGCRRTKQALRIEDRKKAGSTSGSRMTQDTSLIGEPAQSRGRRVQGAGLVKNTKRAKSRAG